MMKESTLGNPMMLSPVEKLRFKIHGFDRLVKKGKRGEFGEPLSLRAHGYDWTVHVYPFGKNIARSSDDVVIDLCLLNGVGVGVTIETEVVIKLGSTERTVYRCGEGYEFRGGFKIPARCKPPFRLIWPGVTERYSFSTRDDFLYKNDKFLDDCGALVVDVELQVYVETPWYPAPTGSATLLTDLLTSSRWSDVTFKVGDQDFHLHRFILDSRAAALFQMIERPDQVITLEDVDAETFRAVIRYIYTEEWSNDSMDLEEAKKLITTSNRFGCTRLKLLVESVMVDKHLSVSNAADMLLLGDSHSCALLKEAAFKICQNNPGAIMESEGGQRLAESSALLLELFSPGTAQRHEPDDTKGQSVAELRNRLFKRGCVDVDGSRAMLVKRLKAGDDQIPVDSKQHGSRKSEV
jgi:BTB/POZ domain